LILRKSFVRSWLGASLLALLTACVTPPAPEVNVAPAAATSRPAPGKAPSPSEAVTAETTPPPIVEEDAPSLLAGETAKEFEQGKASWYGPRFNGRRTASGERYNMHELTAAHKTLPFGTVVRVRSLVNGKEVDVRITDRGPFSRGRVIDLSRAAAESIGMLGLGVKDVLLLVPDSTSPIAQAPRPPVKKMSHPASRAPGQSARQVRGVN